MENSLQTPKERLGEFWGIKTKMQCCCKRRKTNFRLYSELENRRHGGNYFYELGTGGASERIWCLILDIICIFTHPLKMKLKRGKDDS